MSNFWEKLPKLFLVLAPMEDVTDVVFREIVYSLARPDVFFTEFTNAEGLTSKGQKAVIHRLKYTKNQRPIVAQIWGTKPDSMFRAAELVRKLGFDGVDINMGCTDKAVVKKGAGAGLIDNFDLVKEIISAVKKGASGLPVSVKTRLGSNEWASFLLGQSLSALTIHARSVGMLMKGAADWNEIAKIVKIKDQINPQTLIIGNGDIKNYKQALEMHKTHKVDGIMIGRGIFLNPWVFEKTLTPAIHTKKQSLQALSKHVAEFKKTWGDTKNFNSLKKFLKMYINNFDGADAFRQKLMNSRSMETLQGNLEDF